MDFGIHRRLVLEVEEMVLRDYISVTERIGELTGLERDAVALLMLGPLASPRG